MDDNKALGNFLQTNGVKYFCLERQNDRPRRRGLELHRKSVYKITTGNGPYVLLHFSNKYQTIYQNYSKARDVLGRLLQGDRWIVDKEKLLILLPYLGPIFEAPNEGNLTLIVKFLSVTNEPVHFKEFTTPRYISRVLSINDRLMRFSNLRRLVSRLEGGKFKFGPGIEDPAFSNFTKGIEKAYLVDLDNFSTDINLDYEFGFLAGDVNLEFPEYKYYMADFERVSRQKIDNIMFLIGYISRLATVILDFDAGEQISKEKAWDIYREIEDISRGLLNTFE